MRATLELPSSIVLLEAALEGLVSANVVLIQAGLVPLSPLDADVRYQREASGFEEWNIATRVLKLGYGDCEDLAAWQAAGHVVDGSDPGARVAIIRSGKRAFHAVCQLSNGEIEDVCPTLGMGSQTRLHALPGKSGDVAGLGDASTTLETAAKFLTSASQAAKLPSNLKQQIRSEAKSGVTPMVMLAIGLGLYALSKTR